MSTKEEINARLSRVGHDMKSMSRNVWLAGLGAVGSANDMGREVIADLVRRGEALDKEGEDEATERWYQMAGRVKTLGDRMERRLEEEMSRGLNRLGAPSRRDIEELSDRVATLTKHVEALR